MSRRLATDDRGFSLLEMLVAGLVTTMFMGAVFTYAEHVRS